MYRGLEELWLDLFIKKGNDYKVLIFVFIYLINHKYLPRLLLPNNYHFAFCRDNYTLSIVINVGLSLTGHVH